MADCCYLCGGELRPGKTTLEIWRSEELLIIKEISAYVCQQCGEAYISAEISEKLDHFLTEYQRYRPDRYVLRIPQVTPIAGGVIE
jgi:YgiT-type zinc finger domain-containing protein